jgi:hypothetical protein
MIEDNNKTSHRPFFLRTKYRPDSSEGYIRGRVPGPWRWNAGGDLIDEVKF